MSALDAVRHPVSALPVVARIDIPGFPDWVGIDEVHPAVWISNRDRNNVARIDPATNTVVAHASVGHGPCSGLAIGHGSVWVPFCPDHEVVRVDPATNHVIARVTLPIASSEGGIAADDHAVWMPSNAGTKLAKIDPATNTIKARITLPAGSATAAT